MEKTNLENFPSSESAKAMLGCVSDGFYDRSYVGKWLFQVMGAEYDGMREIVLDLPAQFFPETATWGLAYHERKWGLSICPALSIEERRKRIFQKRDLVAPMTPHAMEGLLKTVTGFKVRVQDIHDGGFFEQKPYLGISHPNEYKVILEGEGDAEIREIRGLLDRVKQSHTVYFLLYYKSYHYQIRILYAEAVRAEIELWPRARNEDLLLDGSWRLDGRRRLNGYDLDNYVDYYPAEASALCRVEMTAGRPEPRVLARDVLRVIIPALHANAVHGKAGFRVRPGNGGLLSGSVQEPDGYGIDNRGDYYPAKVSAMCRVQSDVGSSSAHVMLRNHLDEGWKLDGERKLNGGLYAL